MTPAIPFVADVNWVILVLIDKAVEYLEFSIIDLLIIGFSTFYFISK